METTKNYALNKPAQDDFYNVGDFNENADIIDEELHALENPVYEDAKTLETLKSGENIGTAFGKIKLAITNLINHLSDKIVHITADERNKWNAKQDSSTAITTGNIGNQSVKYAGNADTVDGWHLSQIKSDAQSRADTSYNNAIDVINAKEKTVLHLSGGTMSGGINMGGYDIAYAGLIQAPPNSILRLAAGTGTPPVRLCSNDRVICSNLNMDTNVAIYALAFNQTSTKFAKENVADMTADEAKKILDVRVVDFDYREEFGGIKNQHGVIAEELLEIIPNAVTVPDDYEEENIDTLNGIQQQYLAVDYSKLVPYLIRQMQEMQKQIDELNKNN